MKNHLERLPTTAQDDLNLPDLVWAFPRRLVVHDRLAGRFWSVEIIWEDPRGVVSRPAGEGPPLTGPEPDRFRVGRLQSNFSRDAYLKAVRRIREYIKNGDVYQVNLSQRFFLPPARRPLYAVRAVVPSQPGAVLRLPQLREFPNLFHVNGAVSAAAGSIIIETRPIKGTRPRGSTPEEDEAQRQELLASPKDDAELSMIVDLLRNDLGKVCKPRTVQVQEHKRLEAYQNVYHLVSTVTGELTGGTSHVDILRATFPGGPSPGAPKSGPWRSSTNWSPRCAMSTPGPSATWDCTAIWT